MLVIAVSAAREVLNWGSGFSDCQGVMVWHGLPVSLCLLGYPFD
ncbi:hypothetical protein [Celeribacter persicus]|uniref:Uncharacterized protein n=1 Tax=Celeribacter persicus TaxID=1651082 RepID=A0A2T5GZ39_9RHOB|nr:hypothetical protein [Celeribacter persicus]PTQ64601.1 hypothetical protein C8N42_1437 [Celeribacter persicus]